MCSVTGTAHSAIANHAEEARMSGRRRTTNVAPQSGLKNFQIDAIQKKELVCSLGCRNKQ
jgi:hypothetical protein